MHKYFQKTCHFTSISASTFCRGLSLLTHKHTLWANMLLCRPCCIWLKVLWVGLVRKGKRGKQWSARSLRDSIIMWESSWTAFIINQKWQCFSLDDRNANPCGTVWKIPFHATVVARVFVRPFLCHHADRSTFQISWWPGMQREWNGLGGLGFEKLCKVIVFLVQYLCFHHFQSIGFDLLTSVPLSWMVKPIFFPLFQLIKQFEKNHWLTMYHHGILHNINWFFRNIPGTYCILGGLFV